MLLMREIRFSVGLVQEGPVTNSWAGWPPATGIQPYLVLRTLLEGEPDPQTGYICNIALLDRLVRERTIPLVIRWPTSSGAPWPTSSGGGGPHARPEQVIRAIAEDLAAHAPAGTRWAAWQLWTTRYLWLEVRPGEPNMVSITQEFEFAAAHRLHCPELSAERNREVFGKCNNPNAHGHNYRLEVTIAGEPEPASGTVLPISQFEQVVKERVLERFDHKHLNVDCPEFARLNPSVENITRVIWSLLDGQFAPARLTRVRVWETTKTYAEYAAANYR